MAQSLFTREPAPFRALYRDAPGVVSTNRWPIDSSASFARCIALAALVVATGDGAQPVRTPNVEAELVSGAQRARARPDEHRRASSQDPRPLAHVLAEPGRFRACRRRSTGSCRTGVTAGAIQWPAPKALPAGPLVNYGYEGEVFHLVDLAVPASLPHGTADHAEGAGRLARLRGRLHPGGRGSLARACPSIRRPQPHPRWSAAITATRDALPKPLAGWQAQAIGEGQKVKLVLTPTAGAGEPGTLRFFPFGEGAIEPSGEQTLARDGDRFVLTLPVAHQLAPGFTRVAGVITSSGGIGGAKAATIDVPMSGSVVAGPKPLDAPAPKLDVSAGAATSSLSLAAALLFAFGGGLLLNLMPCVFPVLSLKVMGFVEHHDAKRTMHREAVAYSAGVILSFVLLALALVALRAAGEQLGWGFQLQSPAVVTALAVLFFLLALNLSGVFEFGMFVPSAVAGWTAKNRTLDAFASGVLAVDRRVAVHRAVHGRRARLRDLAVDSGDDRRLRRARRRHGAAVRAARLVPGLAPPVAEARRVDGARQAVPRVPAVRDGRVARLGARRAGRQRRGAASCDRARVRRVRGLGVARRSAAAGRGSGPARSGDRGAPAWRSSSPRCWRGSVGSAQARTSKALDAGEWRAFSPAAVAALTASGRPVFVDFTAAWCVTCQVNKRLVLNDADVRSAFAKRNVALVRADWTRRDPDDHAGAGRARPQRRSGLRALPSGQGAAAAARSAAARTRARRAGDALESSLRRQFRPPPVGARSCPCLSLALHFAAVFGSSPRAALRPRPDSRRPTSPSPTRAGKAVKLADQRGKYRRARVDESGVSVRAEALRQREHAGAAEGVRRQGRRVAVRQLDEHARTREFKSGSEMDAMDDGTRALRRLPC